MDLKAGKRFFRCCWAGAIGSGALVAIAAAEVRADSWHLIDASADGRYLSIETETIVQSGSAVNFWAAIEQSANLDFPDGMTIETQYAASCDNKLYRSEQSLAYAGTGEVLYHTYAPGALNSAEPGTRIYSAIEIACSYGS